MEIVADASSPSNAPSETCAIAPTGDTILVVGDRKIGLRVHSLCMRNGSKVFDAMFGPHFTEGQPTNGSLPKEIHMPDDDAKAMTTICKVIHHRNDLLPDVLEPGELPEIAVTADKYDCVIVLKYVMTQWLVFKEPVIFLDLGSLMVAAYILNNPNAFLQITHKLITGTSDSYHSLVNVKYGEIIPLSVYYSLERARTHVRVKVQEALLTEMASCYYGSTKGALGHMQVLLGDNLYAGGWLFMISIDSAIEKAGKMAPPAACQDYHKKQQSKETLYSSLEKLRGSGGLCLGCVRSGNIDATLPCKLDH